METTDTFTLKPIGHMKSLFHFKNGTPRQSSLCENARGVLTIEKSVFNNPEHSLEGLQEYSHAWILFVFHKNNNSHKKAKVKPPRLDGKRMGVFSTRSPYRPNNIGLSLVKIDKIQGATIHFSGIDILDGTPIIDIKPYIPSYDKPTIHNCSVTASQANNNNCNESESMRDLETASTPTATLESVGKLSTKNRHCRTNDSISTSLSLNSTDLTNPDNKQSFISVEEGFYSLSAALDKAGETLKSEQGESQSKSSNKKGCRGGNNGCENIGGQLVLDCNYGASCRTEANVDGNEIDDNEDNALLDMLVGDVISMGASQMLLSGDSNVEENSKSGSSESNSISPVSDSRSATNQTKLCDSSKSDSTEICNDGSTNKSSKKEQSTYSNLWETSDVNECSDKDNDNSAVTAPWLSQPPVSKVNVIFSREALAQLQRFHPAALEPRFRTDMLTGSEDAKKAIGSILYEEPRSVYRRTKCQDSVYYFAIDVLHVTCWFDGEDAVTVLRVRPVADVPQLKKETIDGNKSRT